VSALQQEALPVPQLLETGSTIQFGDPVQYGTIKRIEQDFVMNKEIAEIEKVKVQLFVMFIHTSDTSISILELVSKPLLF